MTFDGADDQALLHPDDVTTMTAARLAGEGPAAPAALRRAAAFIDGHAHEPITVADIAWAAGG